MKFPRPVIVASACALLSVMAWAADPVDHTAHHPGGTAPTSPAPNPTPGTAMGSEAARMETQMKAMREMHEKMMNAKTPEARQALMAEHMKAVQGGMSMMGGMAGAAKDGVKGNMPSDLPARHQMMEKRMEMMETMMLMMMDRMPSSPPK